AQEEGLTVGTVPEVSEWADLIMILTPDQDQRKVYSESIQPHLGEGKALAFAHGFNIRFGYIEAPEGVDVLLIAPKAPGHTVRRECVAARGIPDIVAVAQDGTGSAWDLARSYARGLRRTRARVIKTPSPHAAEYGDYVSGPKVVGAETKKAMKEVLADIQSGAFAKRFIDDQDAGAPEFKELRANEAKHQIETVGKDLRKMFSWSAQAIDTDYVEGSAAR